MNFAQGAAIAAAIASMYAAGAVVPGHAQAATKIKCEGGNSCRGQGTCKGADHTCQGKNSCRGKGWTMEPDAATCEKKGGKARE